MIGKTKQFYPVGISSVTIHLMKRFHSLKALLWPFVVCASICVGAQGASTKAALPEMMLILATRVERIEFAPRGRALVVYDSDGSIQLWDVSGPNLKLSVSDSEIRTPAVFSSDGKYFVTSWSDGRTLIRQSATGRVVRTLSGFGDVSRVATNGDLIAGGDEKRIRIFRVPDGKLLRSIARPYASRLSLSPDGRLLSANGSDFNAVNAVTLWDVRSGRRLSTTNRGNAKLRLSTTEGNRLDALGQVLFSPDGKSFWTSGVAPGWRAPGGNWGDAGYPVDYAAKEWDTHSGKLKRIIGGWTTRSVPYQPLAFSSDNKNLICGGSDGLDILRLRDGKLLRRAPSFDTFSISPTRRVVAVMSGNDFGYFCEIYATEDGRLLRRIALGQGLVRLALAGDDQTLVVARHEPYALTWWNWRSSKKLASLAPPRRAGQVSSLLFAPDGMTLGSHHARRNNGSLLLWNTRTARLKEARPGAGTYAQLAFAAGQWSASENQRGSKGLDFGETSDYKVVSPDGSLVAVASRNTLGDDEDEFLSVFEVADKKLKWKARTGRGTTINGMVFAPDGRTLATSQPNARGTSPANFSLWDVESGAVRHVLDKQSGAWSFGFSGDGRRVAGWAGSGVRVWDVNSGELLATLRVAGQLVDKIAPSPDGKRVAVSDPNGEITLWDVASAKVLLRWIALLPDNPGDGSNPELALKSLDWIAVTPQGYYDASPGAERWIRWRLGSQTLSTAHFKRRLQRSDLIRKILATH